MCTLSELYDSDFNTKIDYPKSAFGELLNAELTPIFQGKFLYDKLNTDLYRTTTTGTGAVSVSNSICNLSVSNAGDSVILESKKILHYKNGQGCNVRFTTIYDTPNTNLNQFSGIGNLTNGFYIGYQGNTFGILYENSGIPDIWNLTVTTGANSATNVTLTLNGTPIVIPVTNAGGLTSFTAHQIANTISSGWNIDHTRSVAYFIATDTNTKSGVFSFNAGTSGVVATLTRIRQAVQPTKIFIEQKNFNINNLLGYGDSLRQNGMTIDHQKLNVYNIKYQWLGGGMITFSVENPITGSFFDFHRIRYANTNTGVSLLIPHMNYRTLISTTSNISKTLKVASVGLFCEGKYRELEPYNSIVSLKTLSANVELVLLNLTNEQIYNNYPNYSEVKLLSISCSSYGNRTVVIRIIKNAVLNGNTTTNYSNKIAVNSNSLVTYDTTSTTYVGGTLVASFQLSLNDNNILDLTRYNYYIGKGENVIVTAFSTQTSDVNCSVSWVEEF
jgi:hypothetical protein